MNTLIHGLLSTLHPDAGGSSLQRSPLAEGMHVNVDPILQKMYELNAIAAEKDLFVQMTARRTKL